MSNLAEVLDLDDFGADELPSAKIMRGLSEANYHADQLGDGGGPSLSSSLAKVLVTKTPEHARLSHPRLLREGEPGLKRENTTSLSEGTILHRLILGAGGDLVLIEADDFRTKAAQAARDLALSEAKIPVLRGDFETYQKAASAIRRRLLADWGIELDGESEVVVVWYERAFDGTPVRCRARIDHLWIDKAIAIDLKTSTDVSADDCSRAISTYEYQVQDAAYRSAIRALCPDARKIDMSFAFAEKAPPNVVTWAELDGVYRDLGEQQWRYAVDTWARCIESGVWPATYANERVRVAPKPWVLAAWEEEV
jgi:hypothetical protein